MNHQTSKLKFLAAFSKAWDIYNELYPSLSKMNYVNFNRMNYYIARSIQYNHGVGIQNQNFYCVCDSGSNHSHNLVQGVFSFKNRVDCETFIQRMGDEIEFLFTNNYFTTMQQAKTLEEARDFFLSNSTGKLECIKDGGATEIVDCYPDAQAFFNS